MIDGDLSDWGLVRPLALRMRTAVCRQLLPRSGHDVRPRSAVCECACWRSAADAQPDLSARVAGRHGMGGCVALRLSTDRKGRLATTKPKEPVLAAARPASAEDLSDKLSFVVLWYCQPQRRACIHLQHGMDMHGLEVNPSGYQGAFSLDADGRGYTLEYSIPWRLLHAENDPPQAGDELAALWLAHWSDAKVATGAGN